MRKQRSDKGRSRKSKETKYKVRSMYASGATYRQIRMACAVSNCFIRNHCGDLMKDPTVQVRRCQIGHPGLAKTHPEKVDHIKELHAAGITAPRISAILGTALVTVRKYVLG